MKQLFLILVAIVAAAGCSKTSFSGASGGGSDGTTPKRDGADVPGLDTTPSPGPSPTSDPLPTPGPGGGNVVYDGKIFTACTSSLPGSLRPGQLVCLGVWEYGDIFGSDPYMCSTTGNPYDAYSNPGVGCEVQIPLCASGRAQALQVLNVVSTDNGVPRASTSDVQLLANYLRVSYDVANREVLRFWKYVCL